MNVPVSTVFKNVDVSLLGFVLGFVLFSFYPVVFLFPFIYLFDPYIIYNYVV